jgi:2-polyprenyl-3-methyl-5-hydroxy-6-metoxy-1,4-benzoquinol methylase
MLISEGYRKLNRELHNTNRAYGTSSGKHVPIVRELAQSIGAKDVLDYGSGKGLLKEGIGEGLTVREYDPAIDGKETPPEPCDLVICTDVLEHIEPECLDDVLSDLARVTRKLGFFTIATRAAMKTLADGRNAHLIQEPGNWWLARLGKHFRLSSFVETIKEEIWVIVRPKAA